MERANHRPEANQRPSAIVSVFFLLLLSVTACVSQDTSSPGSVRDQSTIPTGSGRDFEPGTGKVPWAQPYGHSASLLVANGLLYAGSDNGQLDAFDPASGQRRWQRQLVSPLVLYAVDQQAVYAGGQNTLYGVRVSDGHPLWQMTADAPIAQVVLAAGVLYLSTIPNGQFGWLDAVRASDGRLLWSGKRQTDTPGLLGVTANGNLSVVDSRSYGGDPHFKQSLHVLRAANGRERWSVPLLARDGMVESVPEQAGGNVYFATILGGVYALRADTGVLLWHVSPAPLAGVAGALQAPTVRIVQGMIYVGADAIRAYRVRDGRLLWQYMPNGNFHHSSLASVSGGIVYYKSREMAGALDARSGRALWQRLVPSSTFRALIVEHGYVIDAPAGYVLRASDGVPIWQHQIGDADRENYLGSVPAYAVTERLIFEGRDDGQIEAFKLSDGSLLWQQQLTPLADQTEPLHEARVQFARTVSYEQALASVYNLGLRLYDAPCRIGNWQEPLALQERESEFSTYHALTVWANANSAPYWYKRLQISPGVTQAVAQGGFDHCAPSLPGGGPPYIPVQQIGALALVGFSAGTSYGDALAFVIGLSFRLADPCYESDRARGLRPSWQPMGQLARFQATHTLQLATTFDNAETWLQQLRAAPTITRVQVTFHLDC